MGGPLKNEGRRRNAPALSQVRAKPNVPRWRRWIFVCQKTQPHLSEANDGAGPICAPRDKRHGAEAKTAFRSKAIPYWYRGPQRDEPGCDPEYAEQERLED